MKRIHNWILIEFDFSIGMSSASLSIRFRPRLTRFLTLPSAWWWCMFFHLPFSSSLTVRFFVRSAGGARKVSWSLKKWKNRSKPNPQIVPHAKEIRMEESLGVYEPWKNGYPYGESHNLESLDDIHNRMVFIWSSSWTRGGYPKGDCRYAWTSTYKNRQNDSSNHFRFHFLLDTVQHHEHLVITKTVFLLFYFFKSLVLGGVRKLSYIRIQSAIFLICYLLRDCNHLNQVLVWQRFGPSSWPTNPKRPFSFRVSLAHTNCYSQSIQMA